MSIYAKEQAAPYSHKRKRFAIKALGISNIVADNFNENLCNIS